MMTPPPRSRSTHALGALAAALLALGLAGCAARTPAPATPADVASDPTWRGREDVRDAIALLNQGNATEARQRLIRVLRRQEDPVARSLIGQIDGDPQQMLGTEYYGYTLREGETLSTIAARALGNPMMFYILARYNNIAVPASVGPGRSILVPGRRPAPPPQRAAPRPTPRPSPPAAAPARPTPAPPAARPAQRAGNPAMAARLRGQGSPR